MVSAALVAMSPWAARFAATAPACPIKSISGLPCPTCGATRAAVALADLDPGAALALNPLVALGWMALILGGLAAFSWSAAGRPLPGLPRRLSLSQRTAAVALVTVNWVYLVAVGT